MTNQARNPLLGNAVPAVPETSSSLEDTGISDGAKLRRLLELEEWISGAHDVPMPATTYREWQEERARLLAELHL